MERRELIRTGFLRENSHKANREWPGRLPQVDMQGPRRCASRSPARGGGNVDDGWGREWNEVKRSEDVSHVNDQAT